MTMGPPRLKRRYAGRFARSGIDVALTHGEGRHLLLAWNCCTTRLSVFAAFFLVSDWPDRIWQRISFPTGRTPLGISSSGQFWQFPKVTRRINRPHAVHPDCKTSAITMVATAGNQSFLGYRIDKGVPGMIQCALHSVHNRPGVIHVTEFCRVVVSPQATRATSRAT